MGIRVFVAFSTVLFFHWYQAIFQRNFLCLYSFLVVLAKDYYEVLGITRDASDSQVGEYRFLC